MLKWNLSMAAAMAVMLCLPACQRAAPVPPRKTAIVTMASQGAPATPAPARLAPPPADYLAGTHWPAAQLHEGNAWISCTDDYAGAGDGTPVQSLDFLSLVDALAPCREGGLVRLRYRGNIGPGFTALVERVGAIARRMQVDERILDLDSTGGQVEEALRAGDAIAGSQWAIWVREGSICHSACVLVLAAGDTRAISGKVGIHRLMRTGSKATTRGELAAELKDVTTQMRDYLDRNGVASTLADQMMTIPNRQLRLLTAAELAQYGLSGINAVQDDLERILLSRQCGEDVVRRRDAFMRTFDARCMRPGNSADDVRDCGRAMESRFGFPDARCPGQDPLAYYARRAGEALPDAPGDPRRDTPAAVSSTR